MTPSEQNLSLNRIRTRDLCDTGAVGQYHVLTSVELIQKGGPSSFLYNRTKQTHSKYIICVVSYDLPNILQSAP